MYLVVTITWPPENKTICRGNGETIRCGYSSTTALPVTWIINGTLFNESALENSTLYRLNDLTEPLDFSLTVFSVNGTTTFQCIVGSIPNMTTSTRGTTMVTDGMYAFTH